MSSIVFNFKIALPSLQSLAKDSPDFLTIILLDTHIGYMLKINCEKNSFHFFNDLASFQSS